MAVLKHLVRLSSAWLACREVSPTERLLYLGRVLGALAMRRRSITYLGKCFHFDTFRTPVLLMGYPAEVGQNLLASIPTPIHSVLDIGANIGQFSATLAYYLPQLDRLDVFEANTELEDYLRQNLPPTSSIFMLGVGPPGEHDFYCMSGASVGSSLSAERATWKGRPPVSRRVEFVKDIKARTGTDTYDLVKIDVEGAEYTVIEHLEVKPKYLWLEISGCQKPGTSHHTSELYGLIADKFGPFDVLYQSEGRANAISDVLFCFTA